MRTRSIVLIIAILLVAAFAALNWGEMVRPSPLSFGLFVTDAPLGAILLGLLAITLVLFLASTAAMKTQSLMDYRAHQKTLEAQRELADKAEASRFVDLRQHMDTQLRELRERDAISASEFEKSRMEAQREIRTQLEQINRTLAARLNELESRLDARLGNAATPVTTVRTAPLNEPAQAQDARDAQLREEARLRDEERLRDERLREQSEARREERATAADRPAESGWRRWF
jgi:ABC-type multidrug transport system fused ATPase/permease subunit